MKKLQDFCAVQGIHYRSIALILRITTIIVLALNLLMSPLYAQEEEQELKYKWQQKYYSTVNNTKSLLYSHEMRNSKLAFVDIDGDGDKDIFVGQNNGEIAFFENQGTRKVPKFELITQQYKAIFEIKKAGRKIKIRNVINVGGRSAPTFIDIDYDGDFDLFIGSVDGRIWYFENQGNNLIPVFKLITSKYAGIQIGKNSVPLFADINLQRKFDLIVGTVKGEVWLYINDGTRKKAHFNTKAVRQIAQLGLETHASPGLFDWDEDGDLDLLVGQKNGTLSLFMNEGTVFSPKWQFTEQAFLLIDIGGESSPHFVDIDGDNDPDLVIGSANPTVFLFDNRIREGKRTMWNLTTNLFNFHKLVVTGDRGSITAGDIDGDGDLDLVVGEKNGNLNYYVNNGSAKEPNWILKSEELMFITGMQNSAPAFGDMDGDGDLDLLVGEKQGQIAFIENIGTPKKPVWNLKSKSFFQIDVGSNSVPRLFDIENDGDLDLLIGNFAGRVILYVNDGKKNEPHFSVQSTRFGSAKVGRNAVPTFFDWNQDKFPDMLVGANNGKVQLFLSPGKTGDNNTPWQIHDKAFFTFNVYSLCHPLISDFNGDNKLDLLLGNKNGDFVLYINEGIEKVKKDVKAVNDNSIDQQEGSLVVEDVEGPVEIEIEEEIDNPEDENQEDFISTEVEESTIKIIDPQFSKVGISLVQNETISKSTPTLGDLDQDGDLDLLVGSSSGAVFYYENQGTENEWDFKLVSEDYVKTKNMANTAPVLNDIDQDGDMDLIIGTQSGKLWLFNNQGSSESPNFVLETDFFKNLWLEREVKPAVIDLDDDGVHDIIAGNFGGHLVFVKNDSSRFFIVRRDYQKIDAGINSAPSMADLNNNGNLEMMVGSDSGKIYFFRNEKEDYQGKWKLIPKYGNNIHFLQGSSPTAYDLDNDNDVDLIVGSEAGRVMLYKNNAIIRDEPFQTSEVEELDE